jgi:monoamine oxidase
VRRRDFLSLCSLLGVGLAVAGCGDDAASDAATTVVIVGAGAAGLTAAHLLTQRGFNVQVLEAGPTHGGRIKRTVDFVDFPIPLGGEWLHADPNTLAEIVNDGDVAIDTELASYAPSDPVGTFDGELTIEPIGASTDLKFVGATWLDFFDQYVLPGIADRIVYDTAVVTIDHSGDGVIVTDARGTIHVADAVIVTVPVTVLRDGDISFVPELSESKRAAIDNVDVWGGIKVFLEFAEPFYPTFTEFPDSETEAGQRAYYDAAYGQVTESHVLGLFAVGAQAVAYQERSGDEQRDFILAELDTIFDGAATPSYIQHVAQDWSAEPFVRQAYLADGADWTDVRTLGQPAGPRLHFAGEAYTDGEDWGSVHAAARSARTAVEALLDRG